MGKGAPPVIGFGLSSKNVGRVLVFKRFRLKTLCALCVFPSRSLRYSHATPAFGSGIDACLSRKVWAWLDCGIKLAVGLAGLADGF